MSNIANQHQCPSAQRLAAAISGDKAFIVIQFAIHDFTILGETRGQGSAHDLVPIAIGKNLIFSINRGN